MIKIYEVHGKTSAIFNIPIGTGKAALEVEFTRGCIDKKNYRPATYRSTNGIEQAIIESSPLFGNEIVLGKVVVTSSDTKPVVPSEEKTEDVVEEHKTSVEHPEVTSFEEAVNVLKAIPGVKATQLRTPQALKKVAVANGISFPNYDFE